MPAEPATVKRPDVSELMAWEDGTLDDDETLDLFQRLVSTGMIYDLQGMYGREAHALGLI